MKTLLCPVDFSANSTAAVRYAIAMNRKLKARIILLHTYETPVLYAEPAFLSTRYSDSAIHAYHLKKLQVFQAKMFGKKTNLKVERILLPGLPSSRICEVARRKKADLIVMGATGTGAGERILVGSNASRVMRQAPCMVLLVPRRARFAAMQKIVYATDLGNDNLEQVRKIAPLARLFRANLQLLYVDRDGMTDREVQEHVINTLSKRKGLERTTGHALHGRSVVNGIEAFLRHHKAGCLAVYTRHRSLIQELYHPSISKKISLHATMPMLILHENDLDSGM